MVSKRNIRGGLALSMNAIVVLILAIAMLGVGLYTVRLVKTRVVGEFEKLEASIPDPSKVTAATPITLSPETLVGGAGETVGLKVNIYNIGVARQLAPNITSCDVIDGVQVNPKQIEQAESDIFTMLVDITKGQAAGRYLCSLSIDFTEEDATITTKTVDLPITIT